MTVNVFSAESVFIIEDAHGTTLTFRGTDDTALHVILGPGCNLALQECLRLSVLDKKEDNDPFENLPVGARRMWVDLPY